jgi:hypothetical protein
MVDKEIPLSDLNLSAFHLYHGNPPELSLQGSKVIFLFSNDDTFFELSARYNSNETIPVLDFVNALRQLKAVMMNKKLEKPRGLE